VTNTNTDWFAAWRGGVFCHYLSPKATYDRLVGIHPGKCSRRDLVAGLYDALHPCGNN
jgi:hypothetical protein